MTNAMLNNDQLEQAAFEAFVQRIQHAAMQLLGDHSARREIYRLCDDANQRCMNVVANRNVDLPVIAILGLKGQGKSWSARAMVLDSDVQRRIPSGVLTDEATTRLYWIGPKPPHRLDNDREIYLNVENGMMLDLPFSYVLLDTPGASDADQLASKIASSATSIAPIVLFVTRHDQMRSAALITLAHRAEGSILVPIITAVGKEHFANNAGNVNVENVPADELKQQTERWIANMQRSAIKSEWLEPIYLEDFEESGDEKSTASRFQNALRTRLQELDIKTITSSQDRQIQAIRQQLKDDVGHVLMREVPVLASAVIDLHRSTEKIPEQAVENVMGSRSQLLVAVRNQLRSQWVSETPAIYFPFRTVLSVLAMTHGAWDRLVLAFSGSLPSLFGSFAAWTKNVAATRKLQSELKDGVHERVESQVTSLLRPIHDRFRHSLRTIQADDTRPLSRASDEAPDMRVLGVEQLQYRSSEIFTNTVERFRIGSTAIIFVATLGTLFFWCLFAGPIVGLYRQYIVASWRAISSSDYAISTFPAPSAAVMFTAIAISVLPVALFCMLAMTFLLRRKRVGFIADQIAAEHRAMIQTLRQQGLLRLDIYDEELQNAQFLVNLEH
jgi:hypothetical protein